MSAIVSMDIIDSEIKKISIHIHVPYARLLMSSYDPRQSDLTGTR